MKEKILSLLKKHYPDYVSGEEVSKMLGISRTAVWKHMKNLKEKGYEIESYPKIGYRLVETPDKLYKHELLGLLNASILGKDIEYREVTGSTNELAKELAEKGAVEGTIVIAEKQTAGKGRMGRSWYSPDGKGLWFTLILRPMISPADAPKLTLVSAVAVAKTLRDLGIPAGIKWPNDILVDERKIAGILTEMNAEIDKVNYVVVGIGMNVDLSSEALPDDLDSIATSLEQHLQHPHSRLEVLATLINNYDLLYKEFINGQFPRILAAWKEMSVTINRSVRITSFNNVEEGIAFDVDEEGVLLLLKDDGSLKRVLSGDVSLRT